MTAPRAGWINVIVNLSLIGLGLILLLLIYALISRMLLTPAVPTTTTTTPQPSEILVGDIIQVEVRNGCGKSGVATDMTRYLRSKGFDVVEMGDHTSFSEEKTLIVDRVGNRAMALKVAQTLGLPPDRVVQEIRQDIYLDVSVIIGLDYASLPGVREQ